MLLLHVGQPIGLVRVREGVSATVQMVKGAELLFLLR